jgi:hypothetical protein
MFKSKITAQELIDQIKGEADIAPDITDEAYLQWLNSLEQMLYSSVIQEQKSYSFDTSQQNVSMRVAVRKPKINLWPLFDSVTRTDLKATLDVSPDGKYTMRVNTETGMLSERYYVEEEVTLPAGTYTLSDNAEPYEGLVYTGQDRGATRVYVYDKAYMTTLAVLYHNDGPTASATFTLSSKATVVLRITFFENYYYGEEGRTCWPQLEVGTTKSEEFLPPNQFMDAVVFNCAGPNFVDEAAPRFEDICAAFADNTQLIKSTVVSGIIFPDTYFKDGEKIGLHLSKLPDSITLVYNARPAIKTKVNKTNLDPVMVPDEFLDLVKAKLRGEAYKLANEDSLAAKWLNDYNVLLEDFKAWLADKQPSFGL